MQGAIDAVESNFNLHVDDYVWIGLNGLVKLVDQLGAVDVMVTNPVMDDFYPSDQSSAGDLHMPTTARGQPTWTAYTHYSTSARATVTCGRRTR